MSSHPRFPGLLFQYDLSNLNSYYSDPNLNNPLIIITFNLKLKNYQALCSSLPNLSANCTFSNVANYTCIDVKHCRIIE